MSGCRLIVLRWHEQSRENRAYPAIMKVILADPDRCLVRTRMGRDHIIPGIPAAPKKWMAMSPQPLVVAEKVSTRSADPASDL